MASKNTRVTRTKFKTGVVLLFSWAPLLGNQREEEVEDMAFVCASWLVSFQSVNVKVNGDIKGVQRNSCGCGTGGGGRGKKRQLVNCCGHWGLEEEVDEEEGHSSVLCRKKGRDPQCVHFGVSLGHYGCIRGGFMVLNNRTARTHI